MFKKSGFLMALMASSIVLAEEPFNVSEFTGIHINASSAPVESRSEFFGYVETQSETADYLLNIKKPVVTRVNDQQDTLLKTSIENVGLNFKFKKPSVIPQNDVIGYAALGAYTDTGWDGVKVVFKSKVLGVCAYSFMHIIGAQLDAGDIEYLVNKHPSYTYIEGHVNTGFMYSVTWYTNLPSLQTLECASREYDETRIKSVIRMASGIDNAK